MKNSTHTQVKDDDVHEVDQRIHEGCSKNNGHSAVVTGGTPEIDALGSSNDERLLENEKISLKKGISISSSTPSMLCTLCCAEPKNACLVHGRISHQVCCYGCARKLFKNKLPCPVCRRRIEKITKNIIA